MLLPACATEPTTAPSPRASVRLNLEQPTLEESARTRILGKSIWTEASELTERRYYCVSIFGYAYAPTCSGTRYALHCVCTLGNRP
jgi:hypothetical protein